MMEAAQLPHSEVAYDSCLNAERQVESQHNYNTKHVRTHVQEVISSPASGSCQDHRAEQASCCLRSAVCAPSAPRDRPRHGGNEASATGLEPRVVHHKAALTQKQNQSAAEGTLLFSTWANIHLE